LWTVLAAGAGVLVGVAGIAGGPVAGLATGAYCGVAAGILRRRRADQAARRSRERAVDALCGLAAELRAGAPASMPSAGLVAASATLTDAGPLSWLVDALRRVADQTGAPLADLLERAAADARATDRVTAAAAAQAAGAQATAWLLAALPAGGIALGYAIGADPLRVLLRTPIGAGCAAGAIALQVAGLAWADRLTRPTVLDRGLSR
jgi:tight adherence protein B